MKKIANKHENIIVCLDSNHSHQHVYKELEIYSKLVTVNSYIIVYDTITEKLSSKFYTDGRWGPGNSPYTAVKEFMVDNKEFIVDEMIFDKLLISNAPIGHLKGLKQMQTDIVIIGGGIVGLTCALQLKENNSELEVIIIDKEKELGMHTSGRNSGVMHAGLYYDPKSLKARVCIEEKTSVGVY